MRATAPTVDPAATDAGSSLRHVLVVGGTVAEWATLGDDRWLELIDDLGTYCSQAGVRWLTLRPYGDDGTPGLPERHLEQQVLGCRVIVDGWADGRRRFAAAMAALDPGDEVNEATVAAALYDPADSEPDLVVVLGPSTQLPPSLVWELAYAELVFLPGTWVDASADLLMAAFGEFGRRRRRFGGLDDE